MSSVNETNVSLRLWGDELEPDRITRLLQCAPDTAFRKGEEIQGRTTSRFAETGFWSVEIPWTAERDLEQQITELLDRLPDDEGVWSEIGQTCEGDLFCGLSVEPGDINQGFFLSPETMKRVAERNLRLEVNVYSVAQQTNQR